MITDRKWDLVIFDLDGTIVDTIYDLAAAVNYALASRNLPCRSLEECRDRVGHGVRNLVWQAMPEDCQSDEALLDELLQVFMSYYTAHIAVKSQPYPGVVDLLKSLRAAGVRLAVASNKFQEGTQTIVSTFFPDVEFCAVLGGTKELPLKPDPAIVRKIFDLSGVDASRAVMVGDSSTDMKTAAAASIPSIAVTWGFKPDGAVPLADAVAHDAEELRALLLDK